MQCPENWRHAVKLTGKINGEIKIKLRLCQSRVHSCIILIQKACSFRFYYRRSYCFYNSRCYSLTMSCHPVATPTPLLLGSKFNKGKSMKYIISFSVILTIIVVTVALILCFVYCIYLWCWKTSELSIPKQ